MKTVDQPTRFVQFAPQSADDRIPSTGATGPSAPIAFVGGFELVRDPPRVSMQLDQQCSRLCAPSVLDHLEILSWFLNVRALGTALAFRQLAAGR